MGQVLGICSDVNRGGREVHRDEEVVYEGEPGEVHRGEEVHLETGEAEKSVEVKKEVAEEPVVKEELVVQSPQKEPDGKKPDSSTPRKKQVKFCYGLRLDKSQSRQRLNRTGHSHGSD